MFSVTKFNSTFRFYLIPFIHIRSLMEIVKTSLESSQLVNVVDSMFTAAGFGDKRELSFEDFLLLMAEHREKFSDASLNTKGTDNNMNPLSILITL